MSRESPGIPGIRLGTVRSAHVQWHAVSIGHPQEDRSSTTSYLSPAAAVAAGRQFLRGKFAGATDDDLVLTACRQELLLTADAAKPILMCEFNGAYPLYVDLVDGRVANAE